MKRPFTHAHAGLGSAICVLFSSCVASHLVAAEFYIAPSGDDANAGTVTVLLTADPALGSATGTTILITAAGTTATGAVQFTCRKGTINPKYLPGSCKN